MRIRPLLAALAAGATMAMSLVAERAGAADQAIVDGASKEGMLVIYTGVERAEAERAALALQGHQLEVGGEELHRGLDHDVRRGHEGRLITRSALICRPHAHTPIRPRGKIQMRSRVNRRDV